MSAPTTVEAATRRLVGLTALRWLPVGLTAPIMVLLTRSRGLTLREIGVLFTVHGLIVVALELPTGGLADILGRRPVVVAGAALHLISCLQFATAHSFAAFLLGVLTLAFGRALDSGPVEAWYVDTIHTLDPRADVAPGLAKHSAADGGGLAVGAVVGGLLPGLIGGPSALAAPYLLAGLLDLVYVAVVLRLLHEERSPRQGGVAAELVAGFRAVPETVGAAVRLSITDRPMRLVLLLTAVGGIGLVACELLGPLRFAELADSTDGGAAVYGTVLATALAMAAFAAMGAAGLRHCMRDSTRATCAALSTLGGVALAVLAGPDRLVVAAVAFTGYYIAHGATWPLLSTILHGRVTAAHRATAVSAMSLAMALGGILGNSLVPLLVGGDPSSDVAFVAVGAVVLLSVVGCLRLPRDRAGQPPATAGMIEIEAPSASAVLRPSRKRTSSSPT